MVNTVCRKCGHTKAKKNGYYKNGDRAFICKNCGSGSVRVLPPVYPGNLNPSIRKDIVHAAKQKIKDTVAAVGYFDAIHKAELAEKLSVDYEVAIGQVNHIIERIKRANNTPTR